MVETDKKTRSFSRDSIANTLVVAIGVSLVCSVLVASTSVLLKPQQAKNQEVYRQKIVLDVAGLYEPGADVEALFADGVEVRLVDLESGDYSSLLDARTFDALEMRNDPQLSIAVPDELDIAGIRRRAIYSSVYIVAGRDNTQQIILPVHGSGLWSTMYGFLALESDGSTVHGLRFYEHAETPGLGDQVEKIEWRAQWAGKQLVDDEGIVRIEVVRGQVQPGEQALHQVDGLAGATLTGRSITNLLQYWTGPHGFGPYLERLRMEARSDD